MEYFGPLTVVVDVVVDESASQSDDAEPPSTLTCSRFVREPVSRIILSPLSEHKENRSRRDLGSPA